MCENLCNSFRPDSHLTTTFNRGRKTQPVPSPHRTRSVPNASSKPQLNNSNLFPGDIRCFSGGRPLVNDIWIPNQQTAADILSRKSQPFGSLRILPDCPHHKTVIQYAKPLCNCHHLNILRCKPSVPGILSSNYQKDRSIKKQAVLPGILLIWRLLSLPVLREAYPRKTASPSMRML